jgi:hypothetical protein
MNERKFNTCSHCNGYGLAYCESCGKFIIKTKEKVMPGSYTRLRNMRRVELEKKEKILLFLSTMVIIACIILSVIPRFESESFITILDGNTGEPLELSTFHYEVYGANELSDFNGYTLLLEGNDLSRLDLDDFNGLMHHDFIVIKLESQDYSVQWNILSLQGSNLIRVYQIT